MLVFFRIRYFSSYLVLDRHRFLKVLRYEERVIGIAPCSGRSETAAEHFMRGTVIPKYLLKVLINPQK